MKLFLCTFALCVVICLGQPVEDSHPNKPKCAEACITVYDPVCCTYHDGSTRTFGNSCFADMYNCQNNLTPLSTVPGECASTT